MHELSVCLALLDKVQQIAAEHGATRVTRIEVKLGPLSGVEAPLLENAYPLAVAGSIAETAELVIDVVPIRVLCSQCGAETDARPNKLICGACGDHRTRVVSGEDLLLQRVELETPDTPGKQAPASNEGQSASN
ncbi:MAG: hydrogenase maturation nickel metallochaperone HypA [Woeseiaceae bacterium]|nr:hydrogenase maturation nickel metallochaperone HypA [Woeseiaceae bacterium]